MAQQNIIRLDKVNDFLQDFLSQQIISVSQNSDNLYKVQTNIDELDIAVNFKTNKKYLTKEEFEKYKNTKKIKIKKNEIGYYITSDQVIPSTLSIKKYNSVEDLYKNNILHNDVKKNEFYYNILSKYKIALDLYNYRFERSRGIDYEQIKTEKNNNNENEYYEKWYVELIDLYQKKLNQFYFSVNNELLKQLIEENKKLPNINIYNKYTKNRYTREELINLIHSTCDLLHNWKKEFYKQQETEMQIFKNIKKNKKYFNYATHSKLPNR